MACYSHMFIKVTTFILNMCALEGLLQTTPIDRLVFAGPLLPQSVAFGGSSM